MTGGASAPRRGFLELSGATAAVACAVVWLTWPQAAHLTTHVVSHVDPFFSMWRVDWIAHTLRTPGSTLFDANIFYPARRTLAMSDATLLEGLAGAPLIWAGLSPVLVYNLLLLGGMTGSGLAMFVLTRRLTGAFAPALLAAVIFALAPFRFEHIMHLELQWAMFMPLTLWAMHRALEDGSVGSGVLAGLFAWLQVLSSIYYGVFLVMAVVVAAPLMMVAGRGRAHVRGVMGLAGGGVLALTLTLPYAMPYRENARVLGDRSPVEMATYSARPASYLAAPPHNRVWGWTAERWGGAELSLFPGLTALVLAAFALRHRPRRVVVLYAAILIVAVELSFGIHGQLYPWLLERVEMLHGLRAPARLGILALCAIAVLAALGLHTLQRQVNGRVAMAASALTLAAVAVEYQTTLTLAGVAPQPDERSNVYHAIHRLGPGVVLEWPLPRLDRLPGFDALYAFWSREHWNPLVNGYSGYYPPEFAELIKATENFPDDRATEFLRERGVRYVVVHHAHLDLEAPTLVQSMRRTAALEYIGRFEAPSGPAELFRLRPA